MIAYVLHPTADGRWRWSIHADLPTIDDPLRAALNAGSAATKTHCDLEGQQNLYTLLAWMAMYGFDREVTSIVWDTDPFSDVELELIDTPIGPVARPKS